MTAPGLRAPSCGRLRIDFDPLCVDWRAGERSFRAAARESPRGLSDLPKARVLAAPISVLAGTLGLFPSLVAVLLRSVVAGRRG